MAWCEQRETLLRNALELTLVTSILTECEYTGACCSNEKTVPHSGSCQAMQCNLTRWLSKFGTVNFVCMPVMN